MDTIIAQAPYFLIVFIRLGAFITFVPFFDNPNFITLAKEGLAFFIALLIFPTLSTSGWVIPNHLLSYILLVTGEILVGILMGLIFMILLSALQVAGNLLGFQMAFTMASSVDMTFGDTSDVLTSFIVLIGTMIFLALGGDHYLLFSLGKSFDLLPPGSIASTQALIKNLSQLTLRSFELGFRLAAPAVILLLAIDVTLSFIGKAAAKIQIFFVGLPLKIAVGLFSMTLMLQFIVSIWGKEAAKLPDYFIHFFKLMRI
ncbi:MAG: flagellar biosynthetic protein FliR [Candidatus Omnitrophota bacterium]